MIRFPNNQDGTSTECTNLYGDLKSKCDTNTKMCKSNCDLNSCGDWINNCGEAVNTCRADVCGTSSFRYNMNDLIGGNLAVGGTASQVTCGLGTSFTGSNDDWFEVTTSQSGYLSVALEGIPFSCDWDVYVYNTGLTELFSGITTGCMEAKTSPSILPAGTYLIKVHRYSGNGQGYLRVKLVECLSNDRTDGTSSQCPIINNKRGTCDLATYKCEYPACISNSQCAANYCCDRSEDSPGGLPLDLRLQGSGNCVLKGDTKQPYLCTS